MSLLIQYLVKLSISLSIVWLFYQFILRRLTFYNSNRWYLLGYTLLAFFIPFINISPFIQNNGGSEQGIINFIPSVNQYTIALEEASHCPAPIWSTGYDKWDFTAFALMAGAGILLLRFFIRYISFIRVRSKSKLISSDGIKIYQVDDSIIPFSFGNAVFINSNLHTEDELREIVRHEFVHVRQKHTIDIIWAELLCILNWYNPFAWLLKRSIRQNLEFIADNKVVENGIDKKQYQYLLLKVIGNNQYNIATQFNFSSLKKRIAMMNKLKSARVHMIKFLFVLPLVAILLLAFRKYNATDPAPKINKAIIVIDNNTHQPIEGVTVTNLNTSQVKVTDANGYFSMELPADKPIDVNMKYTKQGYHEFITHSFSLEKKSNTESINLVEVVALKKGRPELPCNGCNSSIRFEDKSDYKTALNYYNKLMGPGNDTIPGRPNSKGYFIDIADDNGNCTVVVKDKNKKEIKRILLNEWNSRATYYEGLYGEISTSADEIEKSFIAKNPDIRKVTVKNNIATVTLKNGKTEVYTLSLSPERKAFEDRCGIQEVAVEIGEIEGEVEEVIAEPVKTVVESKISTTVSKPVSISNVKSTVQEAKVATNVHNSKNSPNKVSTTIAVSPVEESVTVQPSPATEVRIVNLGGLTFMDEGQYILLDGKEVKPDAYDKLKGPYRITFLDKKSAEKKYGEKARQGAIILDTVR